MIESDAGDCDDPEVRHALHLLVTEIKEITDAAGWFPPRPEEPPDIEEIDDDWEW